ncbi:MAG: hypothetical protein WCB68_14630 [Pyrinomonadaceae bacterium]
MKVVTCIFGIVIAAIGGALAYHGWFVEARTAALITSTGAVHEMPNLLHVIGGIILLIFGAALAFFSLRRRRA